MDDFNWDIPSSTIKNNREWKKKIHGGFWCSCCDVKHINKTVRMVLKTSVDPGRLDISDPNIYLVGPDGRRMDN
jgi:hypothetical protein